MNYTAPVRDRICRSYCTYIQYNNTVQPQITQKKKKNTLHHPLD